MVVSDIAYWTARAPTRRTIYLLGSELISSVLTCRRRRPADLVARYAMLSVEALSQGEPEGAGVKLNRS